MSSILPIGYNGAAVDLSPRFVVSTTVVASPALAAETIIASVTIPDYVQVSSGVWLSGWAAFTVGTSGTAVTFRLRQTSVAGTSIVSSGALTSTAANVNERSIFGWDTAPPSPGVYKLTMQVTNGAAASTVSAVTFAALVV